MSTSSALRTSPGRRSRLHSRTASRLRCRVSPPRRSSGSVPLVTASRISWSGAARTWLAASSIANGSPSRAWHSLKTRSRSGVGSAASAASARSRKSWVAAPSAGSGGRAQARSPARLSASLLVQSTVSSGHASRSGSTKSTTPSRRCSQLSRTRAHRPRWRRVSAICSTPAELRSTAAPAAAVIWSGDSNAASSAIHTPPGSASTPCNASSLTSLVFPVPPGPTTVTGPGSATSSRSRSSSSVRPTNVVRESRTLVRRAGVARGGVPSPATRQIRVGSGRSFRS